MSPMLSGLRKRPDNPAWRSGLVVMVRLTSEYATQRFSKTSTPRMIWRIMWRLHSEISVHHCSHIAKKPSIFVGNYIGSKYEFECLETVRVSHAGHVRSVTSGLRLVLTRRRA